MVVRKKLVRLLNMVWSHPMASGFNCDILPNKKYCQINRLYDWKSEFSTVRIV